MSQGKKISDKLWKEFIEVYKNNYASAPSVCRSLHISSRSFYRHIADDTEFRKEIDSINELIHLPLVEAAQLKKAIDGDGASQRFFLMYRGGAKWNPVLQADSFYQRQKEQRSEEQYVPDDPVTLIAKEVYYILRKKQIGFNYKIGDGYKTQENLRRDAAEIMSAMTMYKQEHDKKIKLKNARKKIAKKIHTKNINR